MGLSKEGILRSLEARFCKFLDENTGDQTSIVGIEGTKDEYNNSLTDGDFLFVGDVTQYTDEMAQDAVGNILTNTPTIDFSYNDLTNTIEANVKPDSITANELDNDILISEFINDENYIDHTDLSYIASPTNGTVVSETGTGVASLIERCIMV